MRFEVSRRIREEFENGRAYYDLHGGVVRAAQRKDWARCARVPRVAHQQRVPRLDGSHDAVTPGGWGGDNGSMPA